MRSLLSFIQLVVLTLAAPQDPLCEIGKFLLTPRECNGITKLHNDLRNFQRVVRINKEKMNEYAGVVDIFVAHVLSLRCENHERSVKDFEEEQKLTNEIIGRGYEHDLTIISSPRARYGIELDEDSPKLLKSKRSINDYKACVSSYGGDIHVDEVQKDLYNDIVRGSVNTDHMKKYQARAMTAGKADFARMHAHRMNCFMTMSTTANADTSSTTSTSCTKIITWEKNTNEIKEKFKVIEKELEKARTELEYWRLAQKDVVQNVFHHLLDKQSLQQVLESQVIRLETLLKRARKAAQEAKVPYDIEPKNSITLHKMVPKMMEEYLNCCQSQPNTVQWIQLIQSELKQKLSKTKTPKRSDFEYFWRKHRLGIHLDYANEMKTSLHCFAETERTIYYKE